MPPPGSKQRRDGRCSRKYQDTSLRTMMTLLLDALKFSRAPLKRTSAEPPLCRGFIIDLSTLSFRNVRCSGILAPLIPQSASVLAENVR